MTRNKQIRIPHIDAGDGVTIEYGRVGCNLCTWQVNRWTLRGQLTAFLKHWRHKHAKPKDRH